MRTKTERSSTEHVEGGNIVVLECREAERCHRLRSILETGGFEVLGSSDAALPRGAARLHIHPVLTEIEVEVLQAMCDHGNATAAAAALKTTRKNIENNLASIRQKLGVSSSRKAMVYALRNGLAT